MVRDQELHAGLQSVRHDSNRLRRGGLRMQGQIEHYFEIRYYAGPQFNDHYSTTFGAVGLLLVLMGILQCYGSYSSFTSGTWFEIGIRMVSQVLQKKMFCASVLEEGVVLIATGTIAGLAAGYFDALNVASHQLWVKSRRLDPGHLFAVAVLFSWLGLQHALSSAVERVPLIRWSLRYEYAT